MTILSQPPQHHEDQRPVVRVPERLLRAAADRLMAGMGGGQDAGERFLQAASAQSLDLRNFWASVDTDRAGRIETVREVVLAIPGSGRTLVLFTSRPRSTEAESELASVIDRACTEDDSALLAQVLLPDDEAPLIPVYQQAGFEKLADLAYMRRPMPRSTANLPGPRPLPQHVTVETAHAVSDSELVEALELSYVDTLDCPGLCGLRPTRDVLASHKSIGTHDPDLWWLIREHGRPAGVLLLNPSPEQGSVELVYLGIAPAIRGKGVARSVLHKAFAGLCDRDETTIHLAVDRDNAPAKGLYESFGFSAYTKRCAMIRRLDR